MNGDELEYVVVNTDVSAFLGIKIDVIKRITNQKTNYGLILLSPSLQKEY